MNTTQLIEFFKRLGHTVYKTSNYSWLISSDGIAYSLPTLENSFPQNEELEKLHSIGVKVILFKTELAEQNSFEFLFQGNNYSLDLFHSKIRNQIKKGLKSCIVKDASIEDLINTGYEINLAVLQKHDRKTFYMLSHDKWSEYITTMFNDNNIRIIGAYVNETLIAYTVFFKVINKYYIYHPFMNFNYSSYNPMNAILYLFINEIIQKEETITISYGLASYSEKKGLDKFKKGMLFEEVPTTRIAKITPKYGIIIDNKFTPLIKLLALIGLISNNNKEKYIYLANSKRLYRSYLKSTNS